MNRGFIVIMDADNTRLVGRIVIQHVGRNIGYKALFCCGETIAAFQQDTVIANGYQFLVKATASNFFSSAKFKLIKG